MTSPAASEAAAASQPLLGLGLTELEAWAEAQGQPRFRGRQLHDWLYSRGARSLEAITVLPRAWRERLGKLPVLSPQPQGILAARPVLSEGATAKAGECCPQAEPGRELLGRSRLLHRRDALDGTCKLLLATVDGLSIEKIGRAHV